MATYDAKARAAQRRYYAANREERLASSRAWRAANREHVRMKNREWGARERDMLLEAYGRQCACCAETEEAFLTLDHIDGVPDHHRDAAGRRLTGGQLYARVRTEGYPDAYRLLCWNCNAARGLYGICPHEVRKLEGVA